MNENLKGLIAFLIVFLALLVMGLIEALLASPAPHPPANIKIQQAVKTAMKYRDGVVILWERPTGKRYIFGNKRLMQETFFPGSLLKLVTAHAALDQGLDPAYHCHGRQKSFGEMQFCWTPKGHGALHLVSALSQSCNLYFYELGQRLGWKPLAQSMKSLGLIWPSGFQPQAKALGEAAIGENPALLLSPAEVAQMWEALLQLGPAGRYRNLFRGLEAATKTGTASGLASLKFSTLAKTGTGDAGAAPYKTHGWIVAATPAQNPQWAMMVFLKNAHGYGAPTALAAQIFSAVLGEGAGE